MENPAKPGSEKTFAPDEFLYRVGLLRRGEQAVWTPLAGGVSSDIWRVDLAEKTVCVKRALANLKVKADWTAPTERSNYEWKWFKFVDRHFPGIVPRPVAHDAEMQMLAMEYLPPENYAVWKTRLLEGETDTDFAARAARFLGKIHARSAFDEEIAASFATDELFFALRIEPYLLATAAAHSDLAPQIKAVAEKTLNAKIALVHGDVSPKNILVGKKSPIFLDAETAWFGDPAFDLAFCLNHFLLKSAFRPALTDNYLKCFRSFAENYLAEVNWERPDEIETRTAILLPMLHLARIDGKSPVEYIADEKTKNKVRRAARKLIENPVSQLSELVEKWKTA